MPHPNCRGGSLCLAAFAVAAAFFAAAAPCGAVGVARHQTSARAPAPANATNPGKVDDGNDATAPKLLHRRARSPHVAKLTRMRTRTRRGGCNSGCDEGCDWIDWDFSATSCDSQCDHGCPPPPDIICNANQYRIGSRPGTCHTCSNIGCQTGAFRRGACGGATNGYACNTCTNAQCAATEYRSGSCSGTHNGYACNTCANLQCGANQYRHGSCSLTSNGYSCRTCTNMVCGKGEYRSGSCQGASNSFTCNACSNVVCPAGEYRSGSCSGTSDGYTCIKQPICGRNECFEEQPGTDYRGTLAKTKSGLACLPWSQELKADGRAGIWTGTSNAAANGAGDHNYCRNPARDEPSPWCYTTSPSKRFELCDVGTPVASCKTKFPLPAHRKIRTGNECTGGAEHHLGQQASVDACRDACIAEKDSGCRYFIFGTGAKAGVCYWEEACDEGTLETDEYDLYLVDWLRAEYLQGASATAKGSCATCSNIVCPAGQFRSGTCSGTTDGFTCNDYGTCAAGQYRTGHTAVTKGSCEDQPDCEEGTYLSGQSDTSRGTCTKQPVCPANEFLAGATGTTRGMCRACANVECGEGLFRTGECSGVHDGFGCNVCSNTRCPLNHYQTGVCSGTTNSFQCSTCDNVVCGTGQFRAGTCGGRSDGFTCSAHADCEEGTYLSGQSDTSRGTCKKQPVCPANEFLAGATTTREGVCHACANVNCGAGLFRAGECSTASGGFTCNVCSNINCRAGTFRTGNCSGTNDGYECTPQPACPKTQYLANSTAAQKGTCTDRPACGTDEFLGGATATVAGACTNCTSVVCPAGQFRAGTCAGTTDGFTCNACDNATCPRGQARNGQCGGVNNGFVCAGCPDRHFKSGETTCTPKKTAAACHSDEIFVAGEASEMSRDDATCARCKGGDHKANATACAAKRSACPPGQLFMAGDDDVRSRDDTTCSPCPDDTFKALASGAGTCTTQPTCGPRQFSSPDSKTAERTCGTCRDGQYQSKVSHRDLACAAKAATCPAGERFSPGIDEVKSRDDTACIPCGADAYKNGTSAAQTCKKQPTCGPGEFIGADSKAAPRGCRACPRGEFLAVVGHRLESCTAWAECGASQFEIATPTSSTDRKCGHVGNCTAQEYEAQAPTATSRRVCAMQSTCGKGQFVSVAATETTDLACGVCANDTYTATAPNRAAACTEQPTCGPGEAISPDSRTAARACKECPAGTFRGDASHRREACTPWTECARDSQFEQQTPSATRDRVCGSTTTPSTAATAAAASAATLARATPGTAQAPTNSSTGGGGDTAAHSGSGGGAPTTSPQEQEQEQQPGGGGGSDGAAESAGGSSRPSGDADAGGGGGDDGVSGIVVVVVLLIVLAVILLLVGIFYLVKHGRASGDELAVQKLSNFSARDTHLGISNPKYEASAGSTDTRTTANPVYVGGAPDTNREVVQDATYAFPPVTTTTTTTTTTAAAAVATGAQLEPASSAARPASVYDGFGGAQAGSAMIDFGDNSAVQRVSSGDLPGSVRRVASGDVPGSVRRVSSGDGPRQDTDGATFVTSSC